MIDPSRMDLVVNRVMHSYSSIYLASYLGTYSSCKIVHPVALNRHTALRSWLSSATFLAGGVCTKSKKATPRGHLFWIPLHHHDVLFLVDGAIIMCITTTAAVLTHHSCLSQHVGGEQRWLHD